MGINSKKTVEEYISKKEWRVQENSNSPYSFGGLNKYLAGEVSKDYWLRTIYPENIAKAYVDGDIHIHDLSGLSLYCCGYSLKDILLKGVRGIPNVPVSDPAKHFDSILNQIANLTTIFQNEILGAVAFNSFDTLLAPFIKYDKLSYEEVKQAMQNFVFSINSNSRGGAEPAFTNLTFDITPPDDLIDEYAIIGGEFVSFTYRSCQQEIDMLNRAFFELMLQGDSEDKLFAYPIPTYNIHSRFDWDNPNNKLLWELAGKFGIPYFANFLNSDLDISDIRSMCCRLSIDLTKLRKKNGGLFGAGDSTGAIGVVTINFPRLGYLAKDKKDYFDRLDKLLDLAKDSLEIKRQWLNTNVINTGLVPAFDEYVGTLDNHFSVIGNVGDNEMCLNFFKKDILDEECRQFCIEVKKHINQKLIEFQEETGHLYNFEATPAESTCYRLALKDKQMYPEIVTQGSGKNVYYTNSCHIPVSKIESIHTTFEHQEELQSLYTGGTVIHIYLNGAISGEQAKEIVYTVCTKYKVPYISISPISRYCDDHGYIKETVDKCPICKKRVKKYQRITGYLRCIDNFNIGKKAEFEDRVQLDGKL